MSNSSTQPDNTSHSVEDRIRDIRDFAMENYRLARGAMHDARRLVKKGGMFRELASVFQQDAQLYLDSARSWRRVLNICQQKQSNHHAH